MKTCLVLSLVIVALVEVCLAAEPGVSKDTASSKSAPLKLTVVVPLRTYSVAAPGKIRWINFAQAEEHIYVLMTNVSAKLVRIWDADCLQGASVLKFEITNVGTGASLTIGKKNANEFMNAGSFLYKRPLVVVLNPGDNYIYSVDLTKYESSGAKDVNIKLKACYQIDPSVEAEKLGVWTGKVCSDYIDCQIRQVVYAK